MCEKKNIPLLSVCLITYNDVKYIREAIDGVLMQKVKYSWEFIIADDCSTDGTREIVLEYKEKYPNIIKLILQENNVGPAKNFMELMSAPRSKYIAYIEGDDYWTDPHKLQRQLEYLENNQDYGLVYSKAKVFNDIKGCFEKKIIGKAFNDKELLLSNTIPTLTTMFRRDLYQRYLLDVKPEEKNWESGDYPIWLWFQFNSKIYFMPDITAAYRLLAESASHSSNLNRRYRFRLNSFNISDYYAKRFCTDDFYEVFLEYWYLFLYFFCLKHNLPDKNEYIKLLKELKHISWRTMIIITIFHDLKFEYAFILLNQNHILRRLLKNGRVKMLFGFGH